VDADGSSIGPATADVVATLRSRISRHVITPGEKLREQALAEEFGVPRTRVREALGMLEQRGLVERIPNRGAIVKRLALDQVFELYDVREVLEGLCARLAAEGAPPGAWDELVSFFEVEMPSLIAGGDYETYIEGIDNLRRAMLSAADNPVLADMLDTIRDQTQVIIRRIIILPGRAEVGLAEHQAVLGALQSRDPHEAESLQRRNIRSARECLSRFRGFVL
jgi:DNA-binding GntR family transcriptional regulator